MTLRWDRRALLAAIGSIPMFLTACGFQPLYGIDRRAADIVVELGDIRIPEIEDRLGQLVRNELLDLVTPLGEPKPPRYVLRVDLKEQKEGLAIKRDATITRFNLTLTAEYELTDAVTRARLNNGTVRATAAYNVVRSEFANVIAGRDAEVRAALVVAEEIKTRLSIYFSRASR
ncbi:MAG: hypothetical protein EXQ93_07020 [Alphaproteobacteria bacterium]|nr:hypothetical protein [Alphaproteobacteria bacterium]